MQFKSIIIPLCIATSILSGCGASSGGDTSAADENLSVRLQIPDSLTGGADSTSPRNIAHKIAGVALADKGGSGQPCAFMGHEAKDDPFRNGFETVLGVQI